MLSARNGRCLIVVAMTSLSPFASDGEKVAINPDLPTSPNRLTETKTSHITILLC